ncbi:tRNA lysidine(34) synthetase TilS [Tissierella sp. MB52-C2]|uniref:tRNA lysidine(34) synthetase TilS n=1 Tax=Tissierella sp. MB52-C2 TaxID=3070999 RepID=UPI00280BEA72|nr:tRNA lysidine(34) synthetase TilS [Tissierella sp. MB52-C2]WMM25415.1 tRNA lysidine(34) synthetase TilS [Tissierella sp. MB52-C2]
MKEKVLATIKEYNLIEENDNIVVGISGGPDSMALLYSLLEVKSSIPFSIHIAHVNHGVRGKDAKSDQLFVERIAKELNLSYYTKDVDMIQYGKENGISSEEAGRELRYGFFREILLKVGKGKIAVAHNMNDQAETLIMRFLRGTGIDGLKGMEFKTKDIIRPILGIDRKEIESYIEKNNIETVLDKTNLEPIYSRNKVRLELIPYIEENFNPNIVNTLWRMSKISSVDSKFLEEYSKERFNIIVKNKDRHSIILDGGKFLQEDKSIQQRIIRVAIEEINDSLQGITEVQINLTLSLFSSLNTGKEIHLSNGIIAKTRYNDLIIEKDHKKEASKYFYKLNLGNTNLEDIKYSFKVEVFPVGENFILNKSKNTRYFDFDIVKGSLGVRNRREGDRLHPFGMRGTKKLKDYFIDEKIPKELRDRIPLIVDEENIIWVVGYRTNDLYKVTKNSKKILSISYN